MEPEPKQEQEVSNSQKRLHFLIGFLGWWLINGLIWLEIGSGIDMETMWYNLCLLPLNAGALVILARSRRWVSLGALSAIAANLVIALIVGLAFYGTCAVPFFVGSLFD